MFACGVFVSLFDCVFVCLAIRRSCVCLFLFLSLFHCLFVCLCACCLLLSVFVPGFVRLLFACLLVQFVCLFVFLFG